LAIAIQTVFVSSKWASGADVTPQRLSVSTIENVSLLPDGTAKISIFLNTSSNQMADLYRKMLGAPDNVSTEEALPIPEEVWQVVDAGDTLVRIPMNVREEFYKSLLKEQLLSLGLNISVSSSSMVPRGSQNECRVMLLADGSFEFTDVVQNASIDSWEIGFGPFNATGLAGITLSKLVFAQELINSLEGVQEFESSWTTRITLPNDSQLLNSSEPNGLNWMIDFGGGSYLGANVMGETGSITVQEQMLITEENITVTPDYLYQNLAQYKQFKIKYSTPHSFSAKLQNRDTESINTNWSFQTGWIEFPEIPLSKTFENKTAGYSLSLNLTFKPRLNISEDIGWQWVAALALPPIRIVHFWSRTIIESSVVVRFEVNATYDKEWSWLVYEKKLYTFSFFAGPVPVWIDLKFAVDVVLNVSAKADFVFTTTVNTRITTGVEWNENGGWGFPKTTEIIPTLGENAWNTYAEVTATPSVRLRLEFMFYSIAGPFVELEPYAEFKVIATLPDFTVNLTLGLGFKINVGIKWDSTVKSILRSLNANEDLLEDQRWPGVYDSGLLWKWTLPWKLNHTDTSHVQPIHAIRILNVSFLPNDVVVVGNTVEINVTIRNEGGFNESSSVSLGVNNVTEDSQSNLYLAAKEDTSLIMPWNTAGLKPGKCSLEVIVDPVNGEIETEDNRWNQTVTLVENNDIALTDLMVSVDKVVAGQNVNVTVAINNFGNVTEDIDLTLYGNSTLIANKQVNSLVPGEQRWLEIDWNTTYAFSRLEISPAVLNLGSQNNSIIATFCPDPVEIRTLWAVANTVHYDVNVTNNIICGNNVTIERVDILNVSDIDIDSLRLNEIVELDQSAPVTIRDCNNDTYPDLIVHFNKTAFAQLMFSESYTHGLVKLEITGKLKNGMPFETTGNFTVRMPGDTNIDGIVDISDAIICSIAFGSSLGTAKWNVAADENGDNTIDIFDIILLVQNFGKQYE
jgi:hypothetical protein